MKPAVVILLSDKRSGSTMFQDELCRHSDIQHVEYSPHTYFETHHWLKGAVMLDMKPELFSGGKVYGGYGGKKNARIYMEDCIKQNVPGFVIPADDRELVFEGWDALCSRYASPVFFEKSPQLPAHWAGLELMLEWIENRDYDVKIIGLIRNPLSVLYSAQKLFHTDPQKRQYGWVSIHENLLKVQKKMASSDFMLCRYEDIIRHPVEEFAKICRFIGVEADSSVGSGVHAGSVNRWESDPFFTVRLDDSVKEMAYRFGYVDDDLINPDKPEPSVLHKLKRKTAGGIRLLFAHVNDRLVKPWRLRDTK
jgi:hypothetical protein